MFNLYENPSIEEILKAREGQWFDRKGSRIDKISLVDTILGFANAEGSVLVLGLEKDKKITGIEDPDEKIHQIRSAVSKFSSPIPQINIKTFPCSDFKNKETKLILIEIKEGDEVYANSKDQVYLRMGDENILLNHEQRTILENDKHKTNLESKIADGASLEDLDASVIEEYKKILKRPLLSTNDLLIGRDLAIVKDGVLQLNLAGILLFAKRPEHWIERARIRILRYEGKKEKTGEAFNVTK